MTLQLIHVDSTVIMTITLLPVFFEHFNSTPCVFTVGKQKFYQHKCTKVLVKSTEYKFCLTWIFTDHEYRREFYISEGSLYHIKFEVKCELKLNVYTMYEIIKYYNTQNVTLKFDNGLSIVGKEQNMGIVCELDLEYEFVKEVEVITNNLKKIFMIQDISEFVSVLFEDEDKTINFVFENAEMSISIFTATYT